MEIMEILGQIAGFLLAYYLLRLAYKLYGKDRALGAVLAAWAAVFILICSLPWFQVWAKSFIATNITAKLNVFGQQVDTVQKTTADMRGQLVVLQTEIDKQQADLAEAQGQIRDAETNVQATMLETHGQLASHQAAIDKHQADLEGVQGKIRDLEASLLEQQSVITNQFQQILKLQSELAVVGAKLSAQGKQLSDIAGLVNIQFGKPTNETFTIQHTNN